MRNAWRGFEVGTEERLRLVGFLVLWVLLWAVVLAQVVLPLGQSIVR
jgi:hypothetical protein